MKLTPDRLRNILCKREPRCVGAQLFLCRAKMGPARGEHATYGLVGKYIESCALPARRLDIRCKGHPLPCCQLDTNQRVTHTVVTEKKLLSGVLAHIRQRPKHLPSPKAETSGQKSGYRPMSRKPDV